MKALFLGYGRMGSALGQAWLERGFMDEIVAIDPNATAAPGLTVFPAIDFLDSACFDFVVIAVKPMLVQKVLAGLGKDLLHGATVVSVAAGVRIETIANALPVKAPIVRAMPNTPALLGAGCTCLFADAAMTSAIRTRTTQLFDAVGKTFWVDNEDMIDAATAISGSGPAYYHLFSESLAAAAEKLGFAPEVAAALVAQTAYGAARLQNAGNHDFAELRKNVTSPGGTTAAAIYIFESGSCLRQVVLEAIESAIRRAKELGMNERTST